MKPFILAALLLPSVVLAHADLEVQIDMVSRQIEHQPGNAALYLRRGELHRVHREWDEAGADFDRAEKLDSGLAVVDLARGQMLWEAGQPEAALVPLNRFLASAPENADGHALRARVQVALHNPVAALTDYDAAVAGATVSAVEHYVERARLLASLGDDRLAEAVGGLDDGLKKLGLVPALQLTAIDLEMARKNFDGALARVDRLAAQMPRKESWLARRGDILEMAGRTTEAREAYVEALAACASLPDTRRQTPAMQELERKLREAIHAKR